jgi:hypothetical protein
MGKPITITIRQGERHRYGGTRHHYTLRQGGKVIKTGSGWGTDGALGAANKARKRLLAKEEGK